MDEKATVWFRFMIDRTKLHGTYRMPQFRIGAKVTCQVRGELRIVGMTDAGMPWPLGTVGRATKSLVVYRDLARAIRRESVSAICHWLGAHPVTVWKWRKALGVPEWNHGTRKLWEANFRAGSHLNGVNAGIAKARNPIRRAKLAAAHRGKRRPPEVVEKARRPHIGAKRSAQSRRKMREAWKRRGKPKPAGGPWKSWEDDLIKTVSMSEVMRWTGRTRSAVEWRRRMHAKM
jgi:hypothetical protein